MKRFEFLFPPFLDGSFVEPIFQPSFVQQRKTMRKDEDGYTIELDIPGFKREEINVYTHGKTLIVNAKKENDNSRAEVLKMYSLDNFNAEEINAKLENGVLTLKLKSKNEEFEKKQIEIQ